MIHSMTAFARCESQYDWGTLSCEMRSINHRYLEVSTYLSEAIRPFEMALREVIRKTLKRGKIECNIRLQFKQEDASAKPSINQPLVAALCAASERIAENFSKPVTIAATDILRFPGVLESKEIDKDDLQQQAAKLLKETLQGLIESRAREGNELNQLFTERLSLMEVELNKVKDKLPEILSGQRERLQNRFNEAKVDLDPGRIEQEMLVFAQRIDIAEEIDRATTHINEVRRVLKQGGVVGRRLDFLMQELNREANTMGSKAVDPLVTHAAVEMKVLIEQIREQVQNVE